LLSKLGQRGTIDALCAQDIHVVWFRELFRRKRLGRAEDHMPGVMNNHIQPSVLLDDLPYRGMCGFLGCDIELDGPQVRIMRRRVFLDGLHLSRVGAGCFAHARIHRVSRIPEGASCKSAETAGCACDDDHLFH
jgi:hypothetical protein